MVNSKYSKVLTIILIIAIIPLLGLLIFIGIDLYKAYTTNSNEADSDSQFNGFIANTDIDTDSNKIATNNTQFQNNVVQNNESTDPLTPTKKDNDFTYAKEYIKIIDEFKSEYNNEEIICDLIYFNDDDIPDLVIGILNTNVSLYMYKNGTVYNLVDTWTYGIGKTRDEILAIR